MNRVFANLKAFLDLSIQLFVRAYKLEPKSIFQIGSLDFIGGLGHSISVLFVAGGIAALDPNGIKPPWWPDAINTSILSAVFVAGGYTLLKSLASYLSWLSSLRGRSIARNLQVDFTSKMLGYLSDSNPGAHSFEVDNVGGLLDSIMMGPRLISISTEIYLRAIRSILTALIILVTLLFVEPWVFPLLFLVFVLPAPMVYLLNRKLHSVSSNMFNLSGKQSAICLRQYYKRADEMSGHSGLSDALVEEYRDDQQISKSLDDFDFYKLANERSSVISSVFYSVGLGCALIFFCAASHLGWLAWSSIIAIVLGMVKIQQCASSLLSIFSTQIRFSPVTSKALKMEQVLLEGHENSKNIDKDDVQNNDSEGSVILVLTGLKFSKSSVSAINNFLKGRYPEFSETLTGMIPIEEELDLDRSLVRNGLKRIEEGSLKNLDADYVAEGRFDEYLQSLDVSSRDFCRLIDWVEKGRFGSVFLSWSHFQTRFGGGVFKDVASEYGVNMVLIASKWTGDISFADRTVVLEEGGGIFEVPGDHQKYTYSVGNAVGPAIEDIDLL